MEETLCPECKTKMVPRNGQYGKFWGCPRFPKCKGTRDSMGRSKAERDSAFRRDDEEEQLQDKTINKPRWDRD